MTNTCSSQNSLGERQTEDLKVQVPKGEVQVFVCETSRVVPNSRSFTVFSILLLWCHYFENMDISVWISNGRQVFDISLICLFDLFLTSMLHLNLMSFQHQLPTGNNCRLVMTENTLKTHVTSK